MTIKDSLYHYISCLRPIADMNEQRFIDNQLKSASLEEMQHYFMEFWLKRNNVQPYELWRQYKEQVDYVDRIYQTPINRGYSSDRGRVYLQYGALMTFISQSTNLVPTLMKYGATIKLETKIIKSLFL